MNTSTRHRRKYAIKRNWLLQAAFRTLRDKHIITAQKHLCCGGCASSDLATRAERMSANGLAVLGVVYFHEQDFERARSTGELYLGYGGYGDFEDVALGRVIVSVMEAHGFSCTWDGTANNRILVHLRVQS